MNRVIDDYIKLTKLNTMRARVRAAMEKQRTLAAMNQRGGGPPHAAEIAEALRKVGLHNVRIVTRDEMEAMQEAEDQLRKAPLN